MSRYGRGETKGLRRGECRAAAFSNVWTTAGTGETPNTHHHHVFRLYLMKHKVSRFLLMSIDLCLCQFSSCQLTETRNCSHCNQQRAFHFPRLLPVSPLFPQGRALTQLSDRIFGKCLGPRGSVEAARNLFLFSGWHL